MVSLDKFLSQSRSARDDSTNSFARASRLCFGGRGDLSPSKKCNRMNWFLLLLFILALSILILQTIMHRKDIVDAWILDGILPYFIFFVLVYSINAIFMEDLKHVTILTSIFLLALNLVPNLKYDFILGFYDPLWHYSFINGITSSGFVPTTGVYAVQYGTTFGLQSLVSSLSQVEGLNTADAMKVFLVLAPLLVPLTLYFVLRKVEASNDLARLIIVSSAIIWPTTYIYSGTISVFYLYAFFVFLLILLSIGQSDIGLSILAILTGAAVVISHDFTSFFLSLSVIILLVLQLSQKRSSSKRLTGFSNFPLIVGLIFVFLAFAHLTLASGSNFATLTSLLKDLVASVISPPHVLPATTFYSGFYSLTMLGKFKVLFVKLSRDVVMVSLAAVGGLIIVTTPRNNIKLEKMYAVAAVPLAIAALMFLMSFLIHSSVEDRGLIYMAAVSPLFVGTSLYHFLCYRHKGQLMKKVAVALVFSLILVSIAETYVWQPLIPVVSTESGNFYAVDWREFNTIYSRSAILFLSTYDFALRIETDVVTQSQILGLTDTHTQSLLTKETPPNSAYILMLSQVGTDAHALTFGSAQDALSNENLLQNALENCSTIYCNGESYIFLNITSVSPLP